MGVVNRNQLRFNALDGDENDLRSESSIKEQTVLSHINTLMIR